MKPIHVFLRHCYHSPNTLLPNRSRPEWFDKQQVFENFKRTINPDLADYKVIYDGFYDPDINNRPAPKWLCDNQTGSIVQIHEGNEAKSFLKTLDVVLSQDLPDDAIIYFLEDDYLHVPGWCEAIIEGFKLGVDYLTGLDHGDKYRDYPDLTSKLFVSDSYHWRTTPSTTNTFAVKMGTLRQDIEIHRKYSENLEITQDHSKFTDLCGRGRVLVSSVPGFSTHCSPSDMSPVINWEMVYGLSANELIHMHSGKHGPIRIH